jgi:hypothetical protein
MWLHSHGRIHGNAEDDYAAVLKNSTDDGLLGQHHLWVAEANGQVIGSITIGQQEDHVAHLLWLCVAPA